MFLMHFSSMYVSHLEAATKSWVVELQSYEYVSRPNKGTIEVLINVIKT